MDNLLNLIDELVHQILDELDNDPTHEQLDEMRQELEEIMALIEQLG